MMTHLFPSVETLWLICYTNITLDGWWHNAIGLSTCIWLYLWHVHWPVLSAEALLSVNSLCQHVTARRIVFSLILRAIPQHPATRFCQTSKLLVRQIKFSYIYIKQYRFISMLCTRNDNSMSLLTIQTWISDSCLFLAGFVDFLASPVCTSKVSTTCCWMRTTQRGRAFDRLTVR